ncbi:DUF4884 domain-containing protein [Parabacteroides sp.]
MKRISFFILATSALLSSIIGFSACGLTGTPIAQSAPDNNPSYKVEYLFEHDGCKVYRFMDMGHYIYFTNCQGDVTSIENDSVRTVNKVRRQPVIIHRQPTE